MGIRNRSYRKLRDVCAVRDRHPFTLFLLYPNLCSAKRSCCSTIYCCCSAEEFPIRKKRRFIRKLCYGVHLFYRRIRHVHATVKEVHCYFFIFLRFLTRKIIYIIYTISPKICFFFKGIESASPDDERTPCGLDIGIQSFHIVVN